MTVRRTLRLGLVAAAVAVLSACSSGLQTLPSATLRPSINVVQQDYDYLIGPGDSLQIFVWNNPEVSMGVTVRPDGKISTPLVEDLEVSGITPTEMARKVEVVLSRYIKDPIVTVIAGGFIGPYAEQVRIIGAASAPQSLPYREHMTVLDVMIAVGGLTDFAAGNSTRLIRIEDGAQQEYRVRLEDLVRDGDISANVDLKPGDILIIPEAWF
ncbi:MAG: XrtA/PEP-CTERM system exopolysaccharide export protein [Pseudomonadota bacterium]|nr:XrtA/PEP-CTERM system exopolysaccharide export protein [Pseudomonadota bacterium]